MIDSHNHCGPDGPEFTPAEHGARGRGLRGTLRYWSYRVALVLQDPRGATTAEYALLLALVAVTLITTLKGLATSLDGKINTIMTTIGNAE